MREGEESASRFEAPGVAEALRELARTPVGRRLILKLAGTTALGLAAGDLGGCGDDGEQSKEPEPDRPREIHDLLFAIGGAAGAGGLRLRAGSKSYPLLEMDAETQARVTARGWHYASMDMASITHVAEQVDLPADRPLALFVTGDHALGTVYVAETIHVPRAAMQTVWMAALGIDSPASRRLVRDSRTFRDLGIGSPERRTAEDLSEFSTSVTPSSIAASLVYKHPEIVSLESSSSAVTMALLLANPAVSDLADQIGQMLEQGKAYAQSVPVVDESGNPVFLTDPDTGQQYATSQIQVSPDLDDRFGRAVRLCVNDVKNSMDLEGKTWFLTPGSAPAPQESTQGPASRAAGAVAAAGDGFEVALSRKDWAWGAKVTIQGFDPTHRLVNIRIYNNFVRYLAVHVQYLDGQGNAIPPARGNVRSTDYSDWVVDVMDMPTLYGVPYLQDNNFQSAVLQFPKDATAARLLVCGLGLSAYGQDWRKFFPEDAYPDRINPDECIAPIIFTALFDIALTLLALAADVKTFSVMDQLKNVSAQAGEAAAELVDEVTAIANATTNTALARTAIVASGIKTTFNLLDNRGRPGASIWNDLQATGYILGRLLVSQVPGWIVKGLLKKIVANLGTEEAANALPMVGQVFAGLSVAGDLATLAECAVEFATSPWVIDNTVRVTYTATVTVQHDPKDAVFPRLATRWTLTPIIGGSGSGDPIQGDVTPVGTRSDPIVVTVTGVPMSGTIQYSIVFENADGAQVGKGVSDILANNDVGNLPREVSITIQEIPIPITAKTVFERQNTTGYSTADGGYTWTTNTQIGGTVQDKTGLLEINSISVGTVSAMAGYIWRGDDAAGRYWIRNLPTIQNEGQRTIQLQTGGPYSRKPLIVYDRLNPDLVNGNNFLLEPDDAGSGYNVRRLKLSAHGGKLGWDVGESWGRFLNPLTCVTQHPAGYLIGVNAETGKLDIHAIPPSPTADTAYPPLARSHAGPGTRPGLTQTPVGVAVTVTNMIVVLEAGANQLQSFDLTGNPVQYFGADPTTLDYYAPLASGASDTLLSLAVDGQGWFYVLSYTGDGSQVSDYAVDVYNKAGQHVVRSPGLNVATFDVDYWRTIFALNYAPLTNTDGAAHLDSTLGVVEPSASICTPRNGS